MNIQNERNEVDALNKKALPLIAKEYNGDPWKYLAKGQNFEEYTYYHNCSGFQFGNHCQHYQWDAMVETTDDRTSILTNGFDIKKTSCPVNKFGHGMYVSRDRCAVMNFYTYDLSKPQDNIITIKAKFNYLNLMVHDDCVAFCRSFDTPELMQSWLFTNGYDGIRYYDLYCTGEEFVIYNLQNISIS